MLKIKNLLWWCFLGLTAVFIMLDWLRNAGGDHAATQEFRDSLVNFVLDASGRACLVSLLSVWFLCLFWVEIRNRAAQAGLRFWRAVGPGDWCRLLLMLFAVFAYGVVSDKQLEAGNPASLFLGIDQSTNILVFLIGIFTAQSSRVLDETTRAASTNFRQLTLAFLVVFLAVACLAHTKIPHTYKYFGDARWTGLWVNPNNYGLLMGTGAVLALGITVSSIPFQGPKMKSYPASRLGLVVVLTALGVMLLGLEKSYSRGAWIATAVGIGYMLWTKENRPSDPWRRPVTSWLKSNWLPCCVVVASLTAIVFSQFRKADWRPVRRALSVANTADFSWRNRVAAWEGALQIVAEHSWLGAGWNRPESIYDTYYRANKIEDARAIEMNDYLMLGATLGIPALFCFCMYFWLSLIKNAKLKMQNEEPTEEEWLKTTCRAGAIVLLVGFWFDGGLFKLATASVFWILLELGSVAGGGKNE